MYGNLKVVLFGSMSYLMVLVAERLEAERWLTLEFIRYTVELRGKLELLLFDKNISLPFPK